MTDELTPTQALALWALLARQGRARDADIKPKADREALVAAGFVEAEKPSKTVALTDRGWHWAATHFDAPLPPAQRTLQDLLARIGQYLQAGGTTLADLIGEAPAPPPLPAKARPTSRPKAPPKQKATPRPRPPSAAALRRLIEEAYLMITGGERGRNVPLNRLRAEMAHLDRTTVDAGLGRILKKDKTASLRQISDMKAIDAAAHEAAFSPAGEPFHMIRIQ